MRRDTGPPKLVLCVTTWSDGMGRQEGGGSGGRGHRHVFMLLCVAETITLLESTHSPIKMKKKKKVPTFTCKNKVIKTAREISEKVLVKG